MMRDIIEQFGGNIYITSLMLKIIKGLYCFL